MVSALKSARARSSDCLDRTAPAKRLHWKSWKHFREKTSGEVIIDGFSIDKDQNKIKQIIGVQLQSAGYYPNLYLNELIDLFAGLYNVRVNADEMLKLVDLRKRRNQNSKNSPEDRSRDSQSARL